MKKKIIQYRYEILLCIIVLSLIVFYFVRGGMFASNEDWINQHSVFPDEFRKIFYKTGNIFPSFNANIGNGQNIYYMAYYGIYNPLYLLSYLLPFVPMNYYVMGMNIVCIFVGTILMYKWLQCNKIENIICFFMALIYALSVPITYHAYTQIMFVNYLPFLIMALIGVDIYFRKKKSALLVISIWLMILTSYYFSISGMLAVTLYAVYRYFEDNKFNIKGFIKEGTRFASRVILAIIMAGILLIPVVMTMSGRVSETTNKSALSIKELLIPNWNIFKYSYSGYGMGLGTIVITSLIAGLTFKKIGEKILTYGLFIMINIPIFSYLLNGKLYIRDKVFIPFIPIVIYVICEFVQKIKKNEIHIIVSIVAPLITIIMCLYNVYGGLISRSQTLLIVDAVLMFILCILSYKKKNNIILLIGIVLCMLYFNFEINTDTRNRLTKSDVDSVEDKNVISMIEDVLEENDKGYRLEVYNEDIEKNANNINRIFTDNQYTTSLYSSTYNNYYQEFRKKIFDIEEPYRNNLMNAKSYNPIYQQVTGTKYVISNTRQANRKVLDTKETYSLYENKNAAPLIYAIGNEIEEKEFNKLEFPYNQIALTEYVITQNGSTKGNSYKEVMKRFKDKVSSKKIKINEVKEKKTSIVKNKDASYTVETGSSIVQNIELKPKDKANVVFIRFDIENLIPNKDMSIRINDITNKLTARSHIYYNANTQFTYVFGIDSNTKNIELEFHKGKYNISNMEMYVAKLNKESRDKLYDTNAKITNLWENGDTVEGKLSLDEKAKIATTIPYDKGFTVLVDGEKTSIERVNLDYIGFDVDKGEHNIEIIFKAPGLIVGEVLTMAGLLLFILMILYEKKVLIFEKFSKLSKKVRKNGDFIQKNGMN